MAEQTSRTQERAVVIGASMGGLAVARALSDRFREVVVIERDKLGLERPEHRAGVPQSWHIHALMMRGQRDLEALFPGFLDTALSLGAVRFDHAADLVSFTNYGWEARYESEFIAVSATRILLEFAERQRFFALTKNATVLDDTRVLDLITESRDGRIRAVGVVTSDPSRPKIPADLVVDCSGRAFRWKEWLRQRSVPLPRESVVDARCGYSSRLYRPKNPAAFPWKGMVSDTAFPHQPQFGLIVPLENSEWMVTLGGFNGMYPSCREEGFLEFARSLATPLYAQALEQAEPLTKVRAFRRLEMRWNHFEAYDHPLGNFIAIGDSAWSFNPHYGQGMSIAVGCARILRDTLAQSGELANLPDRYYAHAKKFAWPQWEGTAQLDLRWNGTEGERPWHSKLSHPITELIVRAGQHDRTVARALLAGAHFLKTPADVLTPRVLARVALYGLKQLGPNRSRFSYELPAPPIRRAPVPTY
jgi:2-polyprenyl-6-methoxyphenol hydroxylase-like FAD-dependent oxidoreductase